MPVSDVTNRQEAGERLSEWMETLDSAMAAAVNRYARMRNNDLVEDAVGVFRGRVVEEEEEADNETPNQRELDLWLLESQVPGCSRETAETAYEWCDGDVNNAMRMATAIVSPWSRSTLNELNRQVAEIRRLVQSPEVRRDNHPNYEEEPSVEERDMQFERWETVVVETQHFESHLIARSTNSLGGEPREGTPYRQPEPYSEASGSESDSEPIPVRLASESSSASDDEEQTHPRAWHRPYPPALHRQGSVHIRHLRNTHRDVIRRHLRTVQEHMDEQIVAAAAGHVLTDGAYMGVMNAIKGIWEMVDCSFVV